MDHSKHKCPDCNAQHRMRQTHPNAHICPDCGAIHKARSNKPPKEHPPCRICGQPVKQATNLYCCRICWGLGKRAGASPEIERLRKEHPGWPPTIIAIKVGVSRQRVSQILERAGLPTKAVYDD